MPEIYKEKSEHTLSQEDLKENQEIRDKSRERIASSLEQSSERNRDKEQSNARHEALELAAAHERQGNHNKSERTRTTPEKQRVNTKAERKRAFNTILDTTQSEMSNTARAFSKVIHNPAIEKTSEALGATIARPNSILAGSVSAFVIVVGIYFIARFFAYPLSGSETLAAFILGWIIGIIYDFFRAMVTGKTN